jgi:hypothetical protein
VCGAPQLQGEVGASLQLLDRRLLVAGTGKTVTLVEMVLQLLKSPGNNILVSAPQNFTCDTFCERLLAAGVKPATMLRVIDPRWPMSRVVRSRGPRSSTQQHTPANLCQNRCCMHTHNTNSRHTLQTMLPQPSLCQTMRAALHLPADQARCV